MKYIIKSARPVPKDESVFIRHSLSERIIHPFVLLNVDNRNLKKNVSKGTVPGTVFFPFLFFPFFLHRNKTSHSAVAKDACKQADVSRALPSPRPS